MDRVHDVEHVERQLTARAVRSFALPSQRHVGHAQTAAVLFVAVRQRDLFPVLIAGLAQFHRTAKAVRIGHAERTFAAIDFDARQMGRPDVETGDDRHNGTAGEIDHADHVRRNVDLDPRALLRLAGDQALLEADPRRTRDPLGRTEQTDQRGQVIRPHVEHRTATGLVVELRIRVPAFVTVAGHESGRRHRPADRAVIHQLSTRLKSATEKRVRRAADTHLFLLGQIEQLLAFDPRDGQRLLIVDRLAGLDGRHRYRRVGLGNRQVHHDVDAGIGNQFIR